MSSTPTATTTPPRDRDPRATTAQRPGRRPRATTTRRPGRRPRASTARPRRRLPAASTAVGLLVVAAAITGALLDQAAPAETPSLGDLLPGAHSGPAAEPDGALTEADGILPDGAGVFDDAYPGVANLDADLLAALRAAATDAGRRGVVFEVNSGWRSPRYQDQLLREAVAEYGSEAEAARWVATADTSPHVSGDAVDIGPYDTMSWLSQHGAGYGLCQIYANEPWHFELRPDAVNQGCPAMYADPTQDPRM